MLKEEIVIDGLTEKLIFYIGKDKTDNFNVITMGADTDIWFHAKDTPSCHVVCILPLTKNNLNKKIMNKIVKVGALLCKKHTTKIKSCKNIEFIYTEIANVTKTNIEGCVITEKTKIILL